MKKLNCPKCGSEDIEDEMITIYGMWGELVDTERVKKCKICGEVIRNWNCVDESCSEDNSMNGQNGQQL